MTAAQVPDEMTQLPPPRAVRWVEAATGARVVHMERLSNAFAAAMHTVDVERAGGSRAQFVLRRWARRDLPPDIGVVDNEAAALTVVGASDLPAPRLIAADARGTECDVPAVLMTRLDGRDDVAPAHLEPWLDGLAAILHEIQSVPVPPGHLGYYRPWSLDTVTQPPPWSSNPRAWERAIEIAHLAVPDATRVLCHRDYHPGNVLWSGGRVSGVVDWTHACRGAAAADVAHCRLNLTVLFGLDVADEFVRRFGPVDHQPWFDIADIVSYGDSDEPTVWRFHDAGRTDITVRGVIEAADAFVAQAVSRYG